MSNRRRLVDPASRARQFMPFAALRGYEELVRQQERIPEPRHELTEEEAVVLSRKLFSLKKGSLVKVTHYCGDTYECTTGAVSHVDMAFRELRVVKKRIAFDDILRIDI